MPAGEELKVVSALNRRAFVKKAVKGAVGSSLLVLLPAWGAWPKEGCPSLRLDGGEAGKRYCFLVDIAACIGCGACCLADRALYQGGGSRFRTWVERYCLDARGRALIDQIEVPGGGTEPGQAVSGELQPDFFVPRLCRMCRAAPCLAACPTGATYRSEEGLILIDPRRCTGCSSCVAACPYSARFLNPRTGKAEKCSWCYERLRQGRAPACVEACPVQARRLVVVDDGSPGNGEILQNGLPVSRHAEERERSVLMYLGWRREAV